MPKKKDRQSEIKESAQKIWLAGLGALAAAEEEGGKLFRSLVERGEKYQSPFGDPVASASKTVRGTVKKARSRAGKTLDDLESAFDEQVGAVLHRLGVPTRSEVSKLTRRVEELTRAVQGEKKKPVRKKAAPRTTAARKKTAGRATRKKAS